MLNNPLLIAAIILAIVGISAVLYHKRKNAPKSDSAEDKMKGGGLFMVITVAVLVVVAGFVTVKIINWWSAPSLKDRMSHTGTELKNSTSTVSSVDQSQTNGSDQFVICYPDKPTEVIIPVCQRFIYDGKGLKFSIKKQDGKWIPVGTDAPWVELGIADKVWIISREKTPVAVAFHFTF